jgi:transcriptional regulator with XRE-family HTH domain
MKRETPLQWEPVLESAGLHSARDLARVLDVSPQTAIRLLHGEKTSRETIEAAAVVLGVTPEDVRKLREELALPPFRLPPEADHLTPRQRAAIVAVVRAMLEPPDDPAPTNGAALAALAEAPSPRERAAATKTADLATKRARALAEDGDVMATDPKRRGGGVNR